VIDQVQRFSQTPLAAALAINGVLVRAATNSQLLLDRLRAESTGSGEEGGMPAVNWRIVVEGKTEPFKEELALQSLKHDGLSFVRISRESFLAGDRHTRSCISFITTDLIREERLFSQYFLRAFVSILDDMKGEKWNES